MQDLIIQNTPSTGGGSGNLKVDKNGALIGTRPEINLIEGSNVTMTVVDNSGANRVDITVNATGGGATSEVFSVADVTASRILGNTYQNLTGFPLLITVAHNCTGTATSTAFCDASATPTTAVVADSGGSAYALHLSFVAMPNFFYKITGTNVGTLVSWRETSVTKGSFTDSGSLAKVYATTYQNTSGGPLWLNISIGTGGISTIVSDASATPTTQIWTNKISAGTAMNVLIPIMSGHFYKITNNGTGSIVSWREYTWSTVVGTRLASLGSRVIYSQGGGTFNPGFTQYYTNLTGSSMWLGISMSSALASTLILRSDVAAFKLLASVSALPATTAIQQSAAANEVKSVGLAIMNGVSYFPYVDNGTPTTSNWFEWIFS